MADQTEANSPGSGSPTGSVDDWEEILQARYPQPESQDAPGLNLKQQSETKGKFRNYRAEARPSVKEFYRLNHRYQTLDFIKQKKREYVPPHRKKMTIWDAMEFLNTLVDDSDPDVDFSQIEHLMQVSESIRRDDHPRWFILTGLIHDLGKILCLFGEPQWCVVGDTFPVGCAFSTQIVFPEFFAENPDTHLPQYSSRLGIYDEGCGLENVQLSWGHDEYLYQVVKDFLPEEALYMIRYHSFYACHRENDYGYLMNDHDREMFQWVRSFNPYDLYSKGLVRPDVSSLKPYYQELIAEYFPHELQW